MKNALVVVLVSALVLSGCAPKAEKFALKEGTPAYALAKDLAAVIPALAPERTTVIVKADELTLTVAEVIQALRDNLGTRADQLRSADAGELKKVLERGATELAERKLLLSAAAAAKTVVPAGEIDKAMQSEYARAGSEQAFRDALNGRGISIGHVKKSVAETLVINTYLAGIVEGGARISEEELRKAYEQEVAGDKTASVRHILVLTQGKTDQEKAQARKKIEDILAKARAGEDFAELARKYSEDPGSRANGGLYENFGRGQMVKPFEDASFSIPVGEISGVVETTYGYHIIKVVDRKKDTRSFEEARGEIESRLKQEKQRTAVGEYIKKLKEEANFRLIGL